MAWQAKLVQPVSMPAGGLTIMVDIIYYDDAAPGTTLHYKTFQFDPGTSATDMLATIRSEGATARAVTVRAASLATQAPVNTTWSIP